MRIRFALAGVALIAVLLAALAAPGSAASAVEWTDPAGDANGLPRVESSPRPSDPELDVLNASFALKGDSLVAAARVQKMGIAQGSFGSVYRFYFKHKTSSYYFQARTATAEYDQLYYSTPGFYRESADGVTDPEVLKCDCKASFDTKTNTATFSIKTEGIRKTLKGGDMTGLYVQTYRRYPNFIPGDKASAPEKSAVTL